MWVKAILAVLAFGATQAAPPRAIAMRSSSKVPALICTVSGAKLLNPAMSADAICAKIAAGVSRAISRPVKRVAALSQDVRQSGQYISTAIRFNKAGVATTALSYRLGTRSVTHPDFSIAVSDRPLDNYVIDQMVLEIKRRINGK